MPRLMEILDNFYHEVWNTETLSNVKQDNFRFLELLKIVAHFDKYLMRDNMSENNNSQTNDFSYQNDRKNHLTRKKQLSFHAKHGIEVAEKQRILGFKRKLWLKKLKGRFAVLRAKTNQFRMSSPGNFSFN